MVLNTRYTQEQLMAIAESCLSAAGATVDLARTDPSLCTLVDSQVRVGESALQILREKEKS